MNRRRRGTQVPGSPPSLKWGRFFGVGAGPGDPELLTVKACQLLRRVPVICVPQSNPSEAGYTWRIIQGYVDSSKQEVMHLRFPMTRDAGQLAACWSEAVDRIGQRLSEGKDCAFVTEGDPMLYSTFVHVYRLLGARFPQVEVEVLPGVSSILAAAARARIPLADGDDRIAILPATASPESLELALKHFDTVVLLKVNRAIDSLLVLLGKHNLLDKAVLVSKVTSSQEEVVHLTDLKEREVEYMSLIIVRK